MRRVGPRRVDRDEGRRGARQRGHRAGDHRPSHHRAPGHGSGARERRPHREAVSRRRGSLVWRPRTHHSGHGRREAPGHADPWPRTEVRPRHRAEPRP